MTALPPGYPDIDLSGLVDGDYWVRPLGWEDREPIRRWRNEQIEILRQPAPLTEAEQERYFDTVVRVQMTQRHPEQVLLAFVEHGTLIGYGGLVHIDWGNERAEVSFITATERRAEFSQDLRAFLSLIVEVAQRLNLHRLTTETYEFRTAFLAELEACGFVREGRLRDHVRTDDGFIDSLAHGLLLPARRRVGSNP